MDTLIVFAAKYLIVIPVIGVVFLFWKQPRETRTRFLITALASFILAYVFAKIGSYLYFDARPFVVGNFTPLIPHAADNGFPSDHTLLASAIAAVATVFNRRIGIYLWILALFIGTARVLAGVHHPVDIIGSAALAAAATWLVVRFYKREPKLD